MAENLHFIRLPVPPLLPEYPRTPHLTLCGYHSELLSPRAPGTLLNPFARGANAHLMVQSLGFCIFSVVGFGGQLWPQLSVSGN